jgi:hypothetical protein
VNHAVGLGLSGGSRQTNMTRLEAEAAWHSEWTFRRPPEVGSDGWFEVMEERARRSKEMQAVIEPSCHLAQELV